MAECLLGVPATIRSDQKASSGVRDSEDEPDDEPREEPADGSAPAGGSADGPIDAHAPAPTESFGDGVDEQRGLPTRDADGAPTRLPGPGDSHHLGEEDETLPGPLLSGPSSAPMSGLREEDTVAGGFAGTAPGESDTELVSDERAPLEAETVLEPGAHSAGTDARRLDLPSAPVSATARDGAAASRSVRYTRPGVARGSGEHAVGELLAGRYELVERIGKGGMGEVWKARHTLLQGMRAIKLIKPKISRDRSFRNRFLREGQTMMRVKHPGVVEVTDLDETRDNRELFMVMEHLAGRTLHEAVRDGQRPLAGDVRDAARIHAEIARGMQRIHDEGIVHKDLKTDNVLLVRGEDGLEHPKVIDFGLAKMVADPAAGGGTGTPAESGSASEAYDPRNRTTLSGTLAYMSPEQFRREPSSFQSDIYAFGVMLFECFTGGDYPLPRGGVSHYVALHKDDTAPPATLASKRLDVDPFVVDLADRCMAPNKEDRPQSFTQIADSIDWWLAAPERRRRRNRLLLMTSTAVALVGVAVWGVFFSGKTASLGALTARVGDVVYREQADGRAYLPGGVLGGLELSAPMQGEPGEPRLAVDGRERTVPTRVDGDRLVASVDLSGEEDGEHEIELRASATAAPTRLRLVVDRAAPTLERLEVAGARGRFTNAEVPEIVARVDEPVAEVFALVRRGDGTQRVPGEQDADLPGTWRIRGTHEGDGPVHLSVVAADRAGNRGVAELTYERDTVIAEPRIADLRSENGAAVLPVRVPVGARLRVAVAEPVVVRLDAGGGPVTQTADGPGELVFDLPAVPEGGLPLQVTVTDRAGNEQRLAARAAYRADVIALETPRGRPDAAARGDADIQLRLVRTYELGGAYEVRAEPRLDADGHTVAGPAAPVAVLWKPGSDPFSRELTIPAGRLADGRYQIVVGNAGEATTQPFTLTVDSRAPVVHAVTVTDAEGREIAPDAWCLTREARVVVDVSDLSLAAAELAGIRAETRPRLGRARYEFRQAFAADGLQSLTLVLRDAAGNTDERTVTVRVDATSPTLDVSARPPPGGFDDQKTSLFGGVVSEPDCTLLFEGPGVVSGDGPVRRKLESEDFEVGVTLREGRHAVAVTAIDRAGRRSAPASIPVQVRRLEVELDPEITWSERGLSVLMEKVEPGDVVIGGRVYAVGRAFIDRSEVTNAEYGRFLEAGGHGAWCHADEPEGWDHTPPAETFRHPLWGAPQMPIVNVAYWDAHAFAVWSGRRLPTEAEWVKAAAKQKDELDLLRWPTGNEWEDGRLVTQELVSTRDFKGPDAAGEGRDESPIGCLHMGGNVSEWVRLERVAEGERTTGVRGGNWFLTRVAADVRGVRAKRYEPSFRADTIGFRCAVNADKVAP